ncbi:unnamed protein product, partial [Rotaria magnacalcarata]
KTVAQKTATPTISIVETCNQLKVALAQVLDQQGEVKLVQVLIDRLVDNVHRLPNMDTTADILRSIFYPFGARTLGWPSKGRKGKCRKKYIVVENDREEYFRIVT